MLIRQRLAKACPALAIGLQLMVNMNSGEARAQTRFDQEVKQQAGVQTATEGQQQRPVGGLFSQRLAEPGSIGHGYSSAGSLTTLP